MRATASVRSELTYATNPVFYNDRDVRRIREGIVSKRYAVTRPDDAVVTPLAVRVTAYDAFRLFRVSGALGAGATSKLYQANGILDRSEFEVFATVGSLMLSDVYSPRKYRREYRHPQTRTYTSAFYAQHWMAASAAQKVGRVLVLRPRARLRLRRFEAPFASRNATTSYGEIKLAWRIFSAVRLITGYQYVVNSADGGAGDHDRSYAQHDLIPELRIHPFAPLVVRGQYAFGFRNYTTQAPASLDPVYRDRTDKLRLLTLSASFQFGSHWSVDMAMIRATVQATRPHDSTVTGEQTSFRSSEFTVGAECSF